MSENWSGIEGYEKYSINELGEVRSRFSNRILKHQVDGKGYPMVFLYNSQGCKMKTIHRLLAVAFIPNPENKPDINHKNGVKTDFSLSNLEWCTKSENMNHAYANDLIGDLHTVKGENHHLSKLKEKDVIDIRRAHAEGAKIRPLARMYNVDRVAIQCIVKRKTWKHVA